MQASRTSGSSLEKFCILAKTASGRACTALIQNVLNSKKIFVVGELLDYPNIQALAGTEYQSSFELLKVFAYGTFSDYHGRFGNVDVGVSTLCVTELRKYSRAKGTIPITRTLTVSRKQIKTIDNRDLSPRPKDGPVRTADGPAEYQNRSSVGRSDHLLPIRWFADRKTRPEDEMFDGQKCHQSRYPD